MLYLHGIGHFHPENIITNEFIAELDIGSDEDWIMERVGIRERRTSLPLDYIRDTKNKDPREAASASIISRKEGGANAAKIALARADLTVQDIGLVISGSCTPDYQIPARKKRKLNNKCTASRVNINTGRFYSKLCCND